MGLMAQLPPDMTPFQIGTTGQWQGTGFSVVGRVRVSWADGSWNEWCLLFGDGRTGWLGEAQGLLMISFVVEPSTPLPRSPDNLQAGGAVASLPASSIPVNAEAKPAQIGQPIGQAVFGGIGK